MPSSPSYIVTQRQEFEILEILHTQKKMSEYCRYFKTSLNETGLNIAQFFCRFLSFTSYIGICMLQRNKNATEMDQNLLNLRFLVSNQVCYAKYLQNWQISLWAEIWKEHVAKKTKKERDISSGCIKRNKASRNCFINFRLWHRQPMFVHSFNFIFVTFVHLSDLTTFLSRFKYHYARPSKRSAAS